MPHWLWITKVIVSDIGFPIGVAAYLLFRLDALLREQTLALWYLYKAVADLATK